MKAVSLNSLRLVRARMLRLSAWANGLFFGVGMVFAQVIPATQPTQQTLIAADAASSARRAGPSVHRAQVVYADGQLKVHAENSSLNSILRQISAETRMKIDGGVLDQRVFGDYGPASAPQVLTDLLEGTGVNMLLVQSASGELAELVLTQSGGGTLPNPNSFREDVDESPAGAPLPPAASPALAIPAPSTTPVASAPPASVTPGPSGIAEPPMAPPSVPVDVSGQGAPPPAAAPPASPNGVKTPEQIYQELQQLRQQQGSPQQ